jgi:hypothetical protein
VSNHNVESVHRWIERSGRARTPDEVSALVSELWDSDADYYPVRKFPDANPRHGVEEIAPFMVSWAAAWDTLKFTVVEVVPVDDVRVFVHALIKAEGHETQARVEGELYLSAWLRNRRILRWEDHLTEAGALRGLGLTAESLEAARLSV